MEKDQPHTFVQKASEPRLMCVCGRPLVHMIHRKDGLRVRGTATPEVVKK